MNITALTTEGDCEGTYDIINEREYHKNGYKIKKANFTFSCSILERAGKSF